jgi:hypothetical protein
VLHAPRPRGVGARAPAGALLSSDPFSGLHQRTRSCWPVTNDLWGTLSATSSPPEPDAPGGSRARFPRGSRSAPRRPVRVGDGGRARGGVAHHAGGVRVDHLPLVGPELVGAGR